MNRRNFLKLFGLMVVPSAVLALPSQEPIKGGIIITSELSCLADDVQYRVDTGYAESEWIDFCSTTWDNLSSCNNFYCSEDREIVITYSDGKSISFEPEWNVGLGEFNEIHIVRTINGIDVLL